MAQQTIVEYDAGINAAVQRLRASLGDSTEKPRYIETLARRGYRFIGTVETEPAQLTQLVRQPANTSTDCDADPADMKGLTFSHFRVLQKLGSGGMGAVYRAEDSKLGRQVALKFLLLKAGEATPLMRERFEREARAAVLLQMWLSGSGSVDRDPKTAGIVPRAALRRRDHPCVCSLVSSIFAQLSRSGGDHGRAEPLG